MARSSRPRDIRGRSRATASSALIGAGGVLVALAAFLPWVRVTDLQNLDLFQLLGAAGEPEPWAWAAVVFGGAVALVAFSTISPRPTDLRVLGFVALAVVGIGGGVGVARLVGTVSATYPVRGAGAGMVLAATAELLFLVAAVLSYRATRAMLPPPATEQARAATLRPIPGWYADPDGSRRVRWWDGTRWTEHTGAYDAVSDEAPEASGSPARSRRLRSPKALTLLVAALLVIFGGSYLGIVTSGTFASAVHPKPDPSPGHGRSGAAPGVPPLGTGYLAAGNGFVDFIQWNEHDGDLAGTAQAAMTKGEAPGLGVVSETLAVAGTLSGSAISLSFDHGPQTFGTLSFGSFTLDFPQPDASLARVTFISASSDQYNSAVASLRQRIDQANQAAADAQRTRQLQQKIDADAAAIAGATAMLSQAQATLDRDVQSVPFALQSQGNDLVTVHQTQLQVAAAAGQPGTAADQVCSGANTVVTQANQVGTDLDRVKTAVDTVGNDLGQVRGLLFVLAGAVGQLGTDEAALPGYRPPNALGQQDVAGAVATANADIAATLTKVNGYVDLANGYAATAAQYAAQAAQVGNCGWSPPPAPSLPRLS